MLSDSHHLVQSQLNPFTLAAGRPDLKLYVRSDSTNQIMLADQVYIDNKLFEVRLSTMASTVDPEVNEFVPLHPYLLNLTFIMREPSLFNACRHSWTSRAVNFLCLSYRIVFFVHSSTHLYLFSQFF
jgi:hypothetical protein